jgi:anti-sigma-K factor RskA
MPRLTPETVSPFRAPSAGPTRRSRSLVATVGALAVAAAAVAVVLGIGLVRADNNVSNMQTAQASRSAAVAAALQAPGHRVLTLDSSTHGEQARVVVLPSGQGYLVSSTLPPLDKGRTYQLWTIEGNQPVSLGLLGASPSQAAFTMAGSTHPSHLSITAEPAGGSVFPTGPIVATGSV